MKPQSDIIGLKWAFSFQKIISINIRCTLGGLSSQVLSCHQLELHAGSVAPSMLLSVLMTHVTFLAK